MTIRKSGVFAALVCAVLVGCTVASREVGSASDVRPIKVLMIGNSFSISTLRYLPKLAEAEGRPLDLASLYIGGCELKRHWANVVAAEADPSKGTYQYDRTTCGKLAESRKTSTIPAALKADSRQRSK